MSHGNQKSVLVIFGKDLPKKNKKWWQQFDRVIRHQDLEEFMIPGSVQEAYQLFCQFAKPKSFNYQGYDLWWVHHDDIYYQFCLPYTQFRNLLLYLKDFKKIYLYQPSFSSLFRYFLEAHGCHCVIYKKRRLFPPLGILIQLFLSGIFLLWLRISQPKLILETSDRFDPPYDFDFRYKFIYQELRERKIPFVELIRSLESWSTVLKHAWRRKRPVVYSAAIVDFLHFLASFFGERKFSWSGTDAGQHFWFLVATHYLRNIRGTIWSIRAMKFIWQWLGVKSAIVPAACNRNFHEVLGCKLAGIKTVGIQHGAIPKYYFISDFMPGFEGEKPLSVDKYGLWSEWWRDYYIKNSQAFRPEQLGVSGHMRPLKGKSPSQRLRTESLKVLFISEGLATSPEITPYLLALLATKELVTYLKFRPYRDGFELWLKKNRPEVYKNILEKMKIFRGTIEEAISQGDVVVGSHSTAVLEALLQLKPFVFFWTDKWGDYFEIKSQDPQGYFFAENPEQLLACIKKSPEVSRDKLKQLRDNFFGNPYQNGSKWVVDQIEKFLKI